MDSLFADPASIRLLQLLDAGGTVHLHPHSGYLRASPGRSFPDGTVLWADLPGAWEAGIEHFPIALFCRLLAAGIGRVRVSIENGVVSLCRDGARITCPQARILSTESGTSPGGLAIREPDIRVQIDPSLQKIHQRVFRCRRHFDHVVVLTLSSPILSVSIRLSGTVLGSSTNSSDSDALVTAVVGLPGMLRALRVAAGGAVEQAVLAIAHREAAVFLLRTPAARITALLPHQSIKD